MAADVPAAQVQVADVAEAEVCVALVPTAQVEHAQIAATQVGVTEVSAAQVEAGRKRGRRVSVTRVAVPAAQVELAEVAQTQIARARVAAAQVEVADVTDTQVEGADVARGEVEDANMVGQRYDDALRRQLPGGQLRDRRRGAGVVARHRGHVLGPHLLVVGLDRGNRRCVLTEQIRYHQRHQLGAVGRHLQRMHNRSPRRIEHRGNTIGLRRHLPSLCGRRG